MYNISKGQLRSFIERLERLEEEKANIATDIKEVFAEAKGMGFDTKTLRKVLQLRKIDADDLKEQEALLDLYMDALNGPSSSEDAETAA